MQLKGGGIEEISRIIIAINSRAIEEIRQIIIDIKQWCNKSQIQSDK